MSQLNQNTDLFEVIEAGDLVFSDLIKYAIVVFGQTKNGKTTFCHHLKGNTLKGYSSKSYSGQIHYKCISQDKDTDARIGDSFDSMTLIPNKFQVDLQTKENGEKHKVLLIDSPGYKDSLGIERLLSTTYFYYRLFEKIQNMKFILLFDQNIWQPTYGQVDEVFEQFFSTFKTIDQNTKKSILKASYIVFTKYDKSVTQDHCKSKLRAYIEIAKKTQKISDSNRQHVVDLLNHIIDQEKIHIFHNAQENKNDDGGHNDLQKINKQTKQFFSRDIDDAQRQTVDMSKINFAKGNIIGVKFSDKSQKVSQNIIKVLTNRCQKTIRSYLQILLSLGKSYIFSSKQLIQTNLRQEKSEEYLRKIQEVLSVFQYKNEQNFGEMRELTFKRFKSKLCPQQIKKTLISNLESIKQILKFFESENNEDLQAMKKHQKDDMKKQSQKSFLGMFKQLFKFIQPTQQTQRILIEYGYQVSRIFEEIRVFKLITKCDSGVTTDKQETPIDAQFNNKKGQAIYAAYLQVFDRMRRILRHSVDQLNEQICDYFPDQNHDQFEQILNIAEEIFMSKNKDILYSSHQGILLKIQLISNNRNSPIQQKIQGLILKEKYISDQFKKHKLKQQLYKEKTPEQTLKTNIISFTRLLQQIRQAMTKEFKLLQSQPDLHFRLKQSAFSCWNCLGYLFEQLHDRQLALRIYDHTNTVSSLGCALWEKQIEQLQEVYRKIINSKPQLSSAHSNVQILTEHLTKVQEISQRLCNKIINYGEYLFEHNLNTKGLSILQKAHPWLEYIDHLSLVRLESIKQKLSNEKFYGVKFIGRRQEYQKYDLGEADIVIKKEITQFVKNHLQIKSILDGYELTF